jgi:hypothetical protein
VSSSGRARFDGRRIKRAFDTSGPNHAAAPGRRNPFLTTDLTPL